MDVRIPLNVSVHVIEARDLVGKNWNGLSDPLVRVTVAGRRQHTEIRRNQLNTTWDQVFQFHQLSLTPDEYLREHILVQVYDANTFVRNELIGQFAFSLEKIRSKGEPSPHQLFRQWIVLTHPHDPAAEQGYLRVTITVLGPGDSPPSHSVQESVLSKYIGSGTQKSSDDIEQRPLRAPTVQRRGYNFAINVFHGEYLPSTDVWGSCDPFIVAKFNGIAMRTPVKRQTRTPKWNQRLVIPVHTPCFSEVVELQLWDYRRASPDVLLATCFVRFSDVLRDAIPPTWFNFYGFPINERNVGSHWICDGPRRSIVDAQSFLGRCLVSLSAKLVDKPIMEDTPCSPAQSPENEMYVLWIDLYQGQDLPVDLGGSALVEFSFGPEKYLRRTKWTKRTRSSGSITEIKTQPNEFDSELDINVDGAVPQDRNVHDVQNDQHKIYVFNFQPQPKHAEQTVVNESVQNDKLGTSMTGQSVCRFAPIEVLLPKLDLKHGCSTLAAEQLFDLVVTVYSKGIVGGPERVAHLRIPAIQILESNRPEWRSLHPVRNSKAAGSRAGGALLLGATFVPISRSIPRPPLLQLNTRDQFQVRAHVYQARNLCFKQKSTLPPRCFVQVKLGHLVANRQPSFHYLAPDILGNDSDVTRTRKVSGYQAPVWHETLVINSVSLPHELSLVPDIEISVYDDSASNNFSGPTLIGRCYFPVALAIPEVWTLRGRPRWLELQLNTATQDEVVAKGMKSLLGNVQVRGITNASSETQDIYTNSQTHDGIPESGAILIKLEVLTKEDSKTQPWFLHKWPKVNECRVSLATIGIRNIQALEAVHGTLVNPIVQVCAQSVPNTRDLMERLARAARVTSYSSAGNNGVWGGSNGVLIRGEHSSPLDAIGIEEILVRFAHPLPKELETLVDKLDGTVKVHESILDTLTPYEVQLMNRLITRLAKSPAHRTSEQRDSGGSSSTTDSMYKVFPTVSLPPLMHNRSSKPIPWSSIPGQLGSQDISTWSNVNTYYQHGPKSRPRKSSMDSGNEDGVASTIEGDSMEGKESVLSGSKWENVPKQTKPSTTPNTTFFESGELSIQIPNDPYYATCIHIVLHQLRRGIVSSDVAEVVAFGTVPVTLIASPSVFEEKSSENIHRKYKAFPLHKLDSIPATRKLLEEWLSRDIIVTPTFGDRPANEFLGDDRLPRDTHWDEQSENSEEEEEREKDFPPSEIGVGYGHCDLLDASCSEVVMDMDALNNTVEVLSDLGGDFSENESQVSDQNVAALWPDDLEELAQQQAEKGIHKEPLEETSTLNPLPFQSFQLLKLGKTTDNLTPKGHASRMRVIEPIVVFKGILLVHAIGECDNAPLTSFAVGDTTQAVVSSSIGPFWFLKDSPLARPDRYPPLCLSAGPSLADNGTVLKAKSGIVPPIASLTRKPQHLRVRVYVVAATGLELPTQSSLKQLNPYLVARMIVPQQMSAIQGTFYISDRVNFKSKVSDPFFGTVVELDVHLPDIFQLEIQVWNCNVLSDDILGTTIIDLEDRWFNPLWHQQRSEGKRLNEFRPLWSPSSTLPQGKLEMWVEMYTPQQALNTPLVDIRPPPPAKWEMRVVLWESRKVPMLEDHRFMDLFVEGNVSYEQSNGEWVTDQKVSTDTYVGVRDGRAIFNWRMKFELEVPCKFPTLTLTLQHQNFLTSNEAIGEVVLPLQSLTQSATSTTKEVIRRPRTWFKIGKSSSVGGASGEIEVEISLVHEAYAVRVPVGQGRDKPNRDPFLSEPPSRTNWVTMFRNFTVGRVLCMLCCLGIPILIVLIILG